MKLTGYFDACTWQIVMMDRQPSKSDDELGGVDLPACCISFLDSAVLKQHVVMDIFT